MNYALILTVSFAVVQRWKFLLLSLPYTYHFSLAINFSYVNYWQHFRFKFSELSLLEMRVMRVLKQNSHEPLDEISMKRINYIFFKCSILFSVADSMDDWSCSIHLLTMIIELKDIKTLGPNIWTIVVIPEAAKARFLVLIKTDSLIYRTFSSDFNNVGKLILLGKYVIFR